jgi:hypothetical protein
VARTNRRLSSIDSHAVQIELPYRLQLTQAGRNRGLRADPGLANAGVEAAILSELVVECGQLRRPERVEPVGVALTELEDHVGHDETVDVERRSGRALRSGGRRQRRHTEHASHTTDETPYRVRPT